MILGFISGMVLCIFIVVVELWLVSNSINANNIKEVLSKQKAIVLNLKNQNEKDIDTIIDNNDKAGRDTLLVDLLK